MPSKFDDHGGRQLDKRRSLSLSNNNSQPLCQGVGNSLPFGQDASKTASIENLHGAHMSGVMQSQNESGLDNGVNLIKDIQVAVSSQIDGSNGQERHLEQISSMHVAMDGHVDPNSRMELVSHSIVLTPYPYSDPHYGRLLNSYGPQASVPPQLQEMHYSRMPLPLEMEEEPVYVNAKQFHGILRRRQARAKAELARKAIKVRKPYLHESRHRHAMRRARGCGGRFLSKKNENNTVHFTSDESLNSGSNVPNQYVSVLGAQWLPANVDKGLHSGDLPHGKRPVVQDTQEHHSAKGNRDGQRLSSMYHSSDGMAGGCMRGTAHRNGGSNGALPIN